jgi:hydrogenase/urease accessory protein HupE
MPEISSLPKSRGPGRSRIGRLLVACPIVLLTALWPSTILAHPVTGVDDFYAGMLHPVTTVELVLPMLALGTYGIGLARRLTRPWTLIAVRVVGSWIAAVGILVPES